MDRTSTQSISVEIVKKAIRPIIRQEVRRAILQVFDEYTSEYPSESAIRKSFIERVEKNEKDLAPEIYSAEDILAL